MAANGNPWGGVKPAPQPSPMADSDTESGAYLQQLKPALDREAYSRAHWAEHKMEHKSILDWLQSLVD